MGQIILFCVVSNWIYCLRHSHQRHEGLLSIAYKTSSENKASSLYLKRHLILGLNQAGWLAIKRKNINQINIKIFPIIKTNWSPALSTVKIWNHLILAKALQKLIIQYYKKNDNSILDLLFLYHVNKTVASTTEMSWWKCYLNL